MQAKVCVDIPVAQVDKPFTYLVPESMRTLIEIGMRVQVPFGSRQMMGIVVELVEDGARDFSGDLKPISELLDYQSFLNSELIELSQFLAQDLQAFQITVLQAMLPAMFKVKYQTMVQIIEGQVVAKELQAQKNFEALESLADEIPRALFETWFSKQQIKEWIQTSVIQMDYQVLDQQIIKTKNQYSTNHPINFFGELQEELPVRNKKQKILVDFILAHWPFIDQDQSFIEENSDIKRADLNKAVEKGWLTRQVVPVFRDPFDGIEIEPTFARQLNPSQQAAFETVLPSLKQDHAQTFLLEGVTGSGKTEVYLQLIAQALLLGKTALLLVPEISLTPQMIRQVKGRFQSGVAVLHSGLSTAEKYDEWRRIITGDVQIVVGARSSIFAPLDNIGVIIIDEEHETTYKQSDNPRYHARDVALWRSQYHQCPLVLGSATPSLESRARAEKGNYTHLRLPERVHQQNLPPVEIVDMTQVSLSDDYQEISPQLREKIEDRLAKNEQVLLLLNRRGYATYLLCRQCGYVLECPNCDISLTYHKAEHRMKCHYCDYHQSVPQVCPQCQSPHIRTHGLGTQKLAETLERLYPQASIIRMDHDTTRKKGAHRELLDQFGRGEGDILIGTQMIAKGLDFENVTLVGVINADTSLHLSDFRASEKTFQLLTQVSGRAGRGQKPGEVIIQTYNPSHYVLQLAQGHRYEDFFYYEMKYRHLGQYPPYFYTTLISVTSKHRGSAQELSYQLKMQLEAAGANQSTQWILLGPSQGPIARINQTYYYQLFMKYKDRNQVKDILNTILLESQDQAKKGIYVNIDHEPLYFI